MSEHEKKTSPSASWHDIAGHFDQEGKPITDAAFGEGVVFYLPSDASAGNRRIVGVFPEAHSVRIRTQSADIRFTNGADPEFHAKGVAFRSTVHDAQLLIRKDGLIGVEVFPTPQPLESAQTPSVVADGQILDSLPNAAPDASREENEPSDEPVAISPSQSTEKQPSVKIKGNLARPPSFKPTPLGTPRVMLQLAEHPDPENRETTVYHFVYATGDWALRIQQKNLIVGEPISVSGYKRPYEHKLKDGTTETRERIFAVHLSQLQKKKTTGQ